MHLNILPELWLIFCCDQQEIQKKRVICDILMTVILGVNMITRKKVRFFSSTLWALSVYIFHFYILRPSKLNSMGSPSSLYQPFYGIKTRVFLSKIKILNKVNCKFFVKQSVIWELNCNIKEQFSLRDGTWCWKQYFEIFILEWQWY